MQLDGMDKKLRNRLWNILYLMVFGDDRRSYGNGARFRSFFRAIWHEFLGLAVDDLPGQDGVTVNYLKSQMLEVWDYLEVYEFIEFIINDCENMVSFDQHDIIENINEVLKTDVAGYQIVETRIVPIINEHEIHSIEKAIEHTKDTKLQAVSVHIIEALKKLADKKSPDYRNSIKESISAVESICKIIADDPKRELPGALKKLKGKISIHGGLEAGFKNLYGYTSDGDGIRHALMDEPNLDQEDAVYMLVSCSAFVNYLIRKADKAGIDIT